MLVAKDGSHTAVSAMHDKEKTTDNTFHILANYIDKIADGDETQVLSSGFHVSKQPTPRQKPILEAIKDLHSGSLKLIARAILDARSYKLQKTNYPSQKMNGKRWESMPMQVMKWRDSRRAVSIIFEWPLLLHRA